MLTQSMLTESMLTESMLTPLTTPMRARSVRDLGALGRMPSEDHAMRSLWGTSLVGTIRSSRLELSVLVLTRSMH